MDNATEIRDLDQRDGLIFKIRNTLLRIINVEFMLKRMSPLEFQNINLSFDGY